MFRTPFNVYNNKPTETSQPQSYPCTIPSRMVNYSFQFQWHSGKRSCISYHPLHINSYVNPPFSFGQHIFVWNVYSWKHIDKFARVTNNFPEWANISEGLKCRNNMTWPFKTGTLEWNLQNSLKYFRWQIIKAWKGDFFCKAILYLI